MLIGGLSSLMIMGWNSPSHSPAAAPSPPVDQCTPHSIPDRNFGAAKVTQTSISPLLKLASLPDLMFGPYSPDEDADLPVISVDISSTDQEIIGFGGAITDATAFNFNRLPSEMQDWILQQYFGQDGIGFTVSRVHINSCDFSPHHYSFDEIPGDFELEHFDMNVTHDAKEMIPLFRKVQDILELQGKKLLVQAAPWSPPRWMKANGHMDHSPQCSEKPGLIWLPEYQRAWALYISKFITAYNNHGVDIWSISPQNEPGGDMRWESCCYQPETMAQFIAGYLGPRMKADHPTVGIYVLDHSKGMIHDWGHYLFQSDAAKYLTGLALHWYNGDHFDMVETFHKTFPKAIIFSSEHTYERKFWHEGSNVTFGDWKFGEGYAHDIIGDLNAGSTGWITWNLLLDSNGGPNHVDNVCDATMMVNRITRSLYIHPQYYFMGHFSKFITRGSKRLGSVNTIGGYTGPNRDYGTCNDDDGLQTTGFLRPDGFIALVVLNCRKTEARFKIREGDRALTMCIPAHAIQTYVFAVSQA